MTTPANEASMAETPKPQAGVWTLTAPDGRSWQAESPIKCASKELRERVPANIALARIFAEVDRANAISLDDAAFLRNFAASLTYNDTAAEGQAKHRLYEIAMRIETGYYGDSA